MPELWYCEPEIKGYNIYAIKHQEAFTIVELMVVVSIMSVLASIVLVAVSSTRSKAADGRRVLEAREIGTAIELYNSAINSYPVVSTNQNAFYNFARNWGSDAGHPIPYNELTTLLQPYISKLPRAGATWDATPDKVHYVNGSPLGVCAGDGGIAAAMLIKNGFGLFVRTDDASLGTRDPEGISLYVYEVYGGDHVRFPNMPACTGSPGGPYWTMSPGAGT